jgi:DNA polymerase
LLWRLKQEPKLLQVSFDPDVAKAQAMVKAVQRDLHKMKAFVRFREIIIEEGESQFVAWFEPSHHIVQAAAPFFTSRFTNMRWSILTPDICMHWDGETLSYSPGASKADAPTEDAGEDLWRAYYRSIFNPARLKVSAMQAQMPKKYWRNLPESSLIPGLIADAGSRTLAMLDNTPTPPRTGRVALTTPSPPLPQDESLATLRLEAQQCRDCPLWQDATQTVFGEGPQTARIVFVGEQPGDQEDIDGRPFVGPAGKLFDAALDEARIERKLTYVTNAVKHFKFEPRGKRRIHKKPGDLEIAACNQWLRRELQLIQPRIVVALGATAARAIFGRAVAVGENRGKILAAGTLARHVLVTVHPSYLLRVPEERRDTEYAQFIADLRQLQQFV